MARATWMVVGLMVAGGAVAYLLNRGDHPGAEPPPPPEFTADAGLAHPGPDTPIAALAPDAALAPVDAGQPKPPPPPPPPVEKTALLGLSVGDMSPADRAKAGVPDKLGGVVITEVDPRSTGAEAHLEKGDVIVRAQTTKTTAVHELREAVGDREHTLLTVYRNGKPFQVVLHKPYTP